ncbi:MAG: hypothetical protein NTW29_06505 [Bacteroidetes bacterium]|nr:hypothetical protein [Bacteroidota bacterium]
MKNKAASLFIFLLFVSLSGFASALPDSIPHRKNTSHITLLNGKILDGYIVQVTDSSVTVISRNDFIRGNFMNRQTIPAEEITEIRKRYRKVITTGGGIISGFLVGSIIGFGLGLNGDCNDPDGNCDFLDRIFATKNFGASMIIATVLGTIGGLIGLFTPKKSKAIFPINGKRNNIRDNRNGIMFY